MSNYPRPCVYYANKDFQKGLFHRWVNIINRSVYTKDKTEEIFALVENEEGNMIRVSYRYIQFVDTNEQLEMFDECFEKWRLNIREMYVQTS